MKGLRYVVLRHEGVADPHYDLMFEREPGSPLMTWRSAVWPIVNAVVVKRLGDHRQAYLEHEGQISGGRGWVKRMESGGCTLELRDGAWMVKFAGGGGLEFMEQAGVWTVHPVD